MKQSPGEARCCLQNECFAVCFCPLTGAHGAGQGRFTLFSTLCREPVSLDSEERVLGTSRCSILERHGARWLTQAAGKGLFPERQGRLCNSQHLSGNWKSELEPTRTGRPLRGSTAKVSEGTVTDQGQN